MMRMRLLLFPGLWQIAAALLLAGKVSADYSIATFACDVTIPVGHSCMGGGISPAKKVIEPLQARGFVLMGADKPFVLISFDWCEIRGSAYDDWRKFLADEVKTDPERVLISSTHVHDAPVMDPEAEFLLRKTEESGAWKNLPAPKPTAAIQLASVCWPDFNRICIQRALLSVRESMKQPRKVTHYGFGKALVQQVASNRRYIKPDGSVSYNRMSRCSDPVAQAADDGPIDSSLRTLSFFDGEKPVCALHSYAVHPMSYYGGGEVSIDFVGLAREQMQKEQPETFHIYASGCAGNVTAGKYNTGDPKNRAVLAQRMHDAMAEAMKNTVRQPLERIGFRLAKIPLGARNTIGFTEDSLLHRLANDAGPFARADAAMGLAWYARVKGGHQIDLPLLDFGPAQLLLLPAESYVEYQLYAQELKPDSFVMVMGYGECGPGYIPIERAWKEKDGNLGDWAWVGPGSEEIMKKAIREAMGGK
jgi:hypothetical protein